MILRRHTDFGRLLGGGGGGGDNPPSLSSGRPVTVATRGGEGRHLTLGGGRQTEPWSYEDGRGEGGPPPTASAGKIRAVKLAPKVYSSHKPTIHPSYHWDIIYEYGQ